jgi:2-oxoglutarate/2-oxoacid ferredoxin oxidoreductase subunit beta
MPQTTTPTKWKDVPTHYCPGCHHGIAHQMVARVLDNLGLAKDTLLASSIGCSGLGYYYIDFDSVESPHGRAPAVATGLKRARPDKMVFTYQGDGDLASIGMGEIMHAAMRGEKITVIFVNNAIYGMTGGQMAPTTMSGQVTSTTPLGRDPEFTGYPAKIAEMVAAFEGCAFSSRVALNNIKHIKKAEKAVKKAFELQKENKGFTLVELLSTCPSGWKLSPLQANDYIETNMIPNFPLGTFKDTEV